MSDFAISHIARNVRDLRVRNALTQNDLAARLKVTRVYVTQIESGSSIPSLARVIELAEVLGVSPCAILKGDYDS